MTQDIKIRHEGMRIGGETVFTDAVVEVRYPYTDQVIGTVPAGTAEHARKAFDIAASYKSTLTRYERQQIRLKRALGAALKRDRSTCRPQKIGDSAVARLSRLPGTSVARTNGRRDVACDQYVVLKAHGAFEVPQTCRES